MQDSILLRGLSLVCDKAASTNQALLSASTSVTSNETEKRQDKNKQTAARQKGARSFRHVPLVVQEPAMVWVTG
jgi:hypothetical protein